MRAKSTMSESISQYSHHSTETIKTFSQFTYGEIRPKSTEQILCAMMQASSKYKISDSYNLTNESNFVDIGSGFGRQVVHAALKVGCKSTGLEIVGVRVEQARKLSLQFAPANFSSLINFIHSEEGNFDLSSYTHIFSYNVLMSSYDKQKIISQLCNTQWRLVAWNLKLSDMESFGLNNVALLEKFQAKNTAGQTSTFYLYSNNKLPQPPQEINQCKSEEDIEVDQYNLKEFIPQEQDIRTQVEENKVTLPRASPYKTETSQQSYPSLGSALSAQQYHQKLQALHRNSKDQQQISNELFLNYQRVIEENQRLYQHIQMLESKERPRVPSFDKTHTITLQKPKVQYFPQGILNLGATCWASVCYQIINTALRSLQIDPITLPDSVDDLSEYYYKIFVQNPPYPDSQPFITNLNRQQDAQEGLQYLLSTHFNYLRKYFTISTEQTTQCQACSQRNVSSAEQTCLNLPASTNFTSSLLKYSSSEAEQYKCEQCNTKCNASITIDIKETKDFVLVSYLRFSFDKETYTTTKVAAEINSKSKVTLAQKDYQLVGIVQHKGIYFDQGHYVYICLIGDSWYCFDDKDVSQVHSIDNELKSAYILLYKLETQPTLEAKLGHSDVHTDKVMEKSISEHCVLPFDHIQTKTQDNIISFYLQQAKEHLASTEKIFKNTIVSQMTKSQFKAIGDIFCDGFSITDPILGFDDFKEFMQTHGLNVYSVKRSWQSKATLKNKRKIFIRIDDMSSSITKELCSTIAEAFNQYRQFLIKELTHKGISLQDATAQAQGVYITKFDDTQDMAGLLYAKDIKNVLEQFVSFGLRGCKNYKTTNSCIQLEPILRVSQFKYRIKFYCKDLHLMQSVSTNKKVSIGMNPLLNCSFKLRHKLQQTQETCLSRLERSTYLNSVEDEQDFLLNHLPSEKHSNFHEQHIAKLNKVTDVYSKLSRQDLWNIERNGISTMVIIFTQNQICLLKAYDNLRSQFIGVLDKMTNKKQPMSIIKKYSLPGTRCIVYYAQDYTTYKQETWLKDQDEKYNIWTTPLNKNVDVSVLRSYGIDTTNISGHLSQNNVKMSILSQQTMGEYTQINQNIGHEILRSYQSHKATKVVKPNIEACLILMDIRKININLISYVAKKLIFFDYYNKAKYIVPDVNADEGTIFKGMLMQQHPAIYLKPKQSKLLFYIYVDGLQALSLVPLAQSTQQKVLEMQKTKELEETARAITFQQADQVLGKRKRNKSVTIVLSSEAKPKGSARKGGKPVGE